jgi:hypothetical protein
VVVPALHTLYVRVPPPFPRLSTYGVVETVAILAPLRNTSADDVAPLHERLAKLVPLVLVIVTDNEIEPPGAVVVTDWALEPVAASSSVTVSVTVRVPADAYVLDGVAPVPVVPSPKFHE